MPIVAIDEQRNRFPQKIMYIAPSRKNFENEYYYPLSSTIQLTSDGVLACFGKSNYEKFEVITCKSIFEIESFKQDKTRYTFIKISFQDLQLGITRQFGKVILPINLTNKQVKKISKFINDYFNDKKE